MKMFRVSYKFILTLPLILLFGQLVHGSEIRRVNYHEGETEDDDTSSSSMEDIPPREEWFRVRADHSVPHQPRSKSVAHGSQDIVVLPSTVRNSEGARDVRIRFPEYPTNVGGNSRHIPVNTRNRGRYGLQKFPEESDSSSSSEEQVVSTTTNRRQGQRKSESASKQGMWSQSQNIRSRNGQNDQHQPREPEQDSRSDELSTTSQRSYKLNRQEDQDNDDEFSDTYQSEQVLPVRNQGNRQRTFTAKPARVSSNDIEILTDLDDGDTPPPHEQVAKMARYIVRFSNWTSMATISTRSPLEGYPFANVFSVSDGPLNHSSGIPYMYLTPLDMSATDLKNDSRASLTMSLAQSDYCKQQQYDPEDPRCAHVILSGRVLKLASSSVEGRFARNALYSKHPEMESWPKDHGWFFAKLDIERIIVLDYFGGAKTVSLDDYLNQSI